MRKFDRGSLIAAVAVTAFVVAAGCGGDKDKTDGDGRHGTAGNVRNGTWRITSRTVSSPLNEFCDFSDTTEVSEEICNLQSEFEQGLEGFPAIACNFVIHDNSYTVSCSGDTNVSGCTVTVSVSGSGDFTDTTYTFLARTIVKLSGPIQCAFTPPCTLNVNENGVWQNAEAGCEDDTTTAADSPILRSWRTVLGIQ